MTVVEVETKKTQLEATLKSSLIEASKFVPGTAEFDEKYALHLSTKGALSKIGEEMAKALEAQNAEAIKAHSVTLAQAIGKLVEGMKVAELVGKPVTALNYYTAADGTVHVVFNPVTHIKSAGTKASGSGPKGKGHTMIVGPDGTQMSITKFVQSNLTESQKTEGSVDYVKYPHTVIDTRPKFDEFCKAHNLVGYKYEIPASVQEVTS